MMMVLFGFSSLSLSHRFTFHLILIQCLNVFTGTSPRFYFISIQQVEAYHFKSIWCSTYGN